MPTENEAGYTALDLDKITGNEKIEVVIEEEVEKPAPELKSEENQPLSDQDQEEKEGSKRPTRSQRLKFQRDNARSRADAAEMRAQDLENRLDKLEKERRDSLKVGAERMKTTVAEQLTGAERDLENAFEQGDKKALSDAQKRISRLVLEQKELENFQLPPEEPRAQKQAAGPHPNGVKWAKDNEWFGRNRKATALAYALDADLHEEGMDPADPDYYQELQRRMVKDMPSTAKLFKGEDLEEEEIEEVEEKPKLKSPGATPKGGASSSKVILTREDVNNAKKWGISIEEVARQKKAQQGANTNMGYTEIA